MSAAGRGSSGWITKRGLSHLFRESGGSNRITKASKIGSEYLSSVFSRFRFHSLAVSDAVSHCMTQWGVFTCLDTQKSS